MGRAICLPDGSNRREILIHGVNTKVSVDSFSVLDAIDENRLEEYVNNLVSKIQEV